MPATFAPRQFAGDASVSARNVKYAQAGRGPEQVE